MDWIGVQRTNGVTGADADGTLDSGGRKRDAHWYLRHEGMRTEVYYYDLHCAKNSEDDMIFTTSPLCLVYELVCAEPLRPSSSVQEGPLGSMEKVRSK
jgi:hypothetical protein